MDIVERLREWQNDDGSIDGLMTGAAEEIELLRKERDGLREALQKVLSVQPIRGDEGSTDIIALAKALLEIDSIARAALKDKQ